MISEKRKKLHLVFVLRKKFWEKCQPNKAKKKQQQQWEGELAKKILIRIFERSIDKQIYESLNIYSHVTLSWA